MSTVKSLAVIALLVGGTSLAIAQNGPPTGSYPPVAGGAAGNPAAPGPNLKSGARSHHGTKHHKMYMSTKGAHHKTLKTSQQAPKQPIKP